MDWITPEWDVPPSVRALTTTRQGGVSAPPYETLNLAMHVGDTLDAVHRNRQIVQDALKWPHSPVFLDQRHTNRVRKIDGLKKTGGPPVADACWTDVPGVPLVVMTADCLPIVLCDEAGSVVAAVHAGWRGLDNGVIGATVATLPVPASRLLAWIGPGISQHHFQVGDEVRERLCGQGRAQPMHFVADEAGRWRMDLAGIAAWQLGRLGLSRVWQSGLCTYSDIWRFYSYRRDGVTGRMGTFVWIEDNQ